MKKKVDYILSKLPDEKTKWAKKFKELAETGDGPAIHDVVCILHIQEYIRKIEEFKIDGLRHPFVNDLLRELAESMLTSGQQLKNLCEERPRKRQLDNSMTPSQNKKPKKLQQKPQNKASHPRPIRPKEHSSQRFCTYPAGSKHLTTTLFSTDSPQAYVTQPLERVGGASHHLEPEQTSSPIIPCFQPQNNLHTQVQFAKSPSACEDMQNTDSSPSHIHVTDLMPFSNDSGVSLTGKSTPNTSVSCPPEISENDEMGDPRLLTPENSSMREPVWSLSQNSYITWTLSSLPQLPLSPDPSPSSSLSQRSLTSDTLLTRPSQNTQNNQNLDLEETGNDHNLDFRDIFNDYPDFDPEQFQQILNNFESPGSIHC
ncbi:hypothetical protein PoB_000403300 [Plakobranchus ocellatus]|uniref:Uncharacterized protein n=1 Tax=Plakobranchus ocellatus TaxID=259542 RepID=A0AAV3Y5S1_9GAST|nr:hypothetical protein PoB_000403300 [Plakobranchus ocellatus]